MPFDPIDTTPADGRLELHIVITTDENGDRQYGASYRGDVMNAAGERIKRITGNTTDKLTAAQNAKGKDYADAAFDLFEALFPASP